MNSAATGEPAASGAKRVAVGRSLTVCIPLSELDLVVGIAKVGEVKIGKVIRTPVHVCAAQRTHEPEFEVTVRATRAQLAGPSPVSD